jgi:hypothetical protein
VDPIVVQCFFCVLTIQLPGICKFSFTCLIHVCLFVMCDLKSECHCLYAVGISLDELIGGGH